MNTIPIARGEELPVDATPPEVPTARDLVPPASPGSASLGASAAVASRAPESFEGTPDRETEPVVPVAPPVAHGGRERATLTVLSGFGAGQVHVIDRSTVVLGRGSEADIDLEDVGVSRRHARIRSTAEGHYWVEDLGSTNGTYVRGERINAEEIHPGDRIQLGANVVLRFKITDDAEEELQRRLYDASTRDVLTRVYNRKYFSERLTAEFAYSRRHEAALAVMVLDLDNFKSINDTHGHLAGDTVLRHIAGLMQKLIRVEDLLARYGGEEFVVLARTTGKAEALLLAERIRAAVSDLSTDVAPDVAIRCTVSIGLAALPDLVEGGPDDLVALADARLYRAKAEGKNRVCATDAQ